MGRGYQISDIRYQEDKKEVACRRGAAEDAMKARQD